MRSVARWLVVSIALAAPAAGQQAEPAAPGAAATPDASSVVSIERIRKELAEPAHPLTDRVAEAPDFKSAVVQEHQLSEVVKSLNFKAGPTPYGGLYNYEQQRVFLNPRDYPYMQPYGAFNGGQLITLVFENLIGAYLAPKAIASLTAARRADAEEAAHDEVRQAIAAYCAAQPHRGSGILICEDPSVGR